ncbi:uncharacterized protein LOC105434639 [Cucumis sativus]|uniref:Uncharacterized protein n=1 Tax=Cucumis sativus TaxID=3659 RepID=A0A0A0LN74_CUCSA|nr:uncharacterized protein LOC105434639 [Cucumis sativus]KGN62434.1 hypothetical protein Csa_018658 [Cucumis sativus]
MKTKNAQNQNKFIRFVTLPIRALGKAKDFYVKSIMDCAPRVSHGYPSGQLPILPKSYSSRSCRSNETDDFRELVKAASVRSLDIKDIDADILYPQRQRQSKGLPKSCSVGMGRIDEDTACEFEEGVEDKAHLAYPRSKSYAVTNSNSGF